MKKRDGGPEHAFALVVLLAGVVVAMAFTMFRAILMGGI